MTTGPDLSGVSTTPKDNKKDKYPNPWGFGKTIGQTPINGSGALIFGSPTYQTRGSFGHPTSPKFKYEDATADVLMQQFVHMTGPMLASIQSKMYRAGGYYSANFVPDYGHIRTEDVAAFKKFVIGEAMNPQAEAILASLDQQADFGDKQGINVKKRDPLVVNLTNPEDLKAITQTVAQKLYGGNLPPEDLDRFVSSYQQMETDAQTQQYNAEGSGGTYTAAPTTQAGIGAMAEAQIRAAHPEQVFATVIGQARNSILGTLGRGGTSGTGQ